MSHIHTKVAIVGGGLAGLACAKKLHALGLDYTVLESANTVGGRVATTSHDGFLLDQGFQVYNTSYQEGERQLDLSALELGFFDAGAMVFEDHKFYSIEDPLRNPLRIFEAVTSSIGTIKDKMLMAKLTLSLRVFHREKIAAMAPMDTYSFLQKYGFSQKIIDGFFIPFFGGVFLDRELQTSHTIFLQYFYHFAAGSAALPKDGMRAIPLQMMQSLSTEKVHTQTKVTSVEANTIHTHNGLRIDAERIVMALPGDQSSKLRGQEDRLHFQGTLQFYFEVEQPAWLSAKMGIVASSTSRIQNIVFYANTQPGYVPANRHLMGVSVNVNQIKSECENMHIEIMEEIKTICGDRVGNIEYLHTARVQRALPLQTPSCQVNSLGFVQFGDHIFGCGDWVVPASIENALLSGRKVAEKIAMTYA